MNEKKYNKTTGKLVEALRQPSLDSAMDEIKSEQLTETLKSRLDELVMERNVKLANVCKKTGLNKSYFYALTEGTKTNPSRDVMIRLCFGFGLDLDETQAFLKNLGAAMLYARNRRDAIIIHALENGLTVGQCNDNLEEYKERKLVG